MNLGLAVSKDWRRPGVFFTMIQPCFSFARWLRTPWHFYTRQLQWIGITKFWSSVFFTPLSSLALGCLCNKIVLRLCNKRIQWMDQNPIWEFFAHENISLESCAQLSQIRNGIFRNSSEEINLRSFHIALMRYSEALLITALSSILRRGRHQVHTWGAPE